MTKILVMEDDSAIQQLLVEILQDRGYDVLSVPNGRDGLKMMTESKFDMVITDRTMPGGPPGEEVVRRIKAEHAGVKIIFMTGESVPQIMAAAKAAGADATLAKPFTPEHLECLVQELLG